MAEQVALKLPFPQNDQLTDRDLAVHESWQRITPQEVSDRMVEPTVSELANGDAISFADKRIKGDNSKEAVALILPWNNSYTETAEVRASYLQDSLVEPRRMLVFPSGKKDFDLTLREGASGKAILAEAIAEAARKAGVEKLHIVGPSQGAMVGAYLMRYLGSHFDRDQSTATLMDPPNVEDDRSGFELGWDFFRSGFGFAKAVNDSGIPALSELFHTRGGPVESVRGLVGQAKFIAKSGSPYNRELKANMRVDEFSTDVNDATLMYMPRRVVEARFQGSLICPRLVDPFTLAMFQGRGISMQYILGNYGHSGPDNVPLFTKIAQSAIEPEQIPNLYT